MNNENTILDIELKVDRVRPVASGFLVVGSTPDGKPAAVLGIPKKFVQPFVERPDGNVDAFHVKRNTSLTLQVRGVTRCGGSDEDPTFFADGSAQVSVLDKGVPLDVDPGVRLSKFQRLLNNLGLNQGGQADAKPKVPRP